MGMYRMLICCIGAEIQQYLKFMNSVVLTSYQLLSVIE